jgi:hypothetical protein
MWVERIALACLHLRLVLGLKGFYVRKHGRTFFRPAIVLGHALRDLARMDQGVGDMRDELLAAYCVVKRCGDVVAAHHVDPRIGWIDVPAMLNEVDEAIAVIVVHVGKEDGVNLRRKNVEL